MIFSRPKLAGFIAVALWLFAAPAQAILKLDINHPNPTPMPIALNDLNSGDSNTSQLGHDIMGVVSADLERSGLFRPIDQSAFIEHIGSGNTIPRFADWRQINAQALVTGTITSDGEKVRVSFRLWDVFGEAQMTGKEFNSLQSNWRRIGHLVADEIYKRITGEDGYFDSRIVYVAESGPFKHRIKRLAIMDQDGENH